MSLLLWLMHVFTCVDTFKPLSRRGAQYQITSDGELGATNQLADLNESGFVRLDAEKQHRHEVSSGVVLTSNAQLVGPPHRPHWYVNNSKVRVIAVETRSGPELIPNETSVGHNLHWQGFVTKMDAIQNYLSQLTDPNILVIVHDGGDVVFGGCSETQFMEDYMKLVSLSNGTEVVVGAERNCYQMGAPCKHTQLERCRRRDAALSTPQACDAIPQVPQWAHARWEMANDATSVEFTKYKTVEPEGQMRYPNSGFIVGPAGKLHKVISRIADRMRRCAFDDRGADDCPQGCSEGRCPGDQTFMAEQAFDKGSLGTVTLDYGAWLCTNACTLHFSDILELQKDGGLYNKITGRDQCFFHANGPNKALISWYEKAFMS